MSRYTGPIVKKSRALGTILFANGESKTKTFHKKNYKPGEHGQKRFSKKSEYSKQLEEKQKAKIIYGISEKQSKRYYKTASKSDGISGIQYLKILERRLDNVIFRAGLASTRPQARQIVSHGMVKINGKRVKTPSIQVKVGTEFEIQEKSKNSKLFEETKKDKKDNTPKWIKVDHKGLKGEVIALPDKNDTEQLIDHQLIIEFYSK